MGIKCSYEEWKDDIRGMIIVDTELQQPSFFHSGYLKLVLKDPKTDKQYTNVVKVG